MKKGNKYPYISLNPLFYKIILFLVFIQNGYSQVSPSWSSEFDHLDYGQVKAIAETSNGDLYLAKNNHLNNVFLQPTVLLYNHLSGQFSDQNSFGYNLSTITALKLIGDSVLFVAGKVSNSGSSYHRIYKKNVNSNNWIQICQTDTYIYAIEFYNNKLFIGGDFNYISGNNFPYLATYDISYQTFDSVPGKLSNPGYNNPVIYCLKNNGTSLVVGGNFQRVGNDTLNSIALYDLNGWHSLKKGIQFKQANSYIPGTVTCIDIAPFTPNSFIIGGTFNYFNNYTHYTTPYDVVAKWNHTLDNWDTIPNFLAAKNYQMFNGPSNLCDIKYYNNDLYISYINPSSNVNGKRIIKINNNNWSLLPISFKDERIGECYLHLFQNDLVISSFNTFPLHGALRYNSNGTLNNFGLGMGYLYLSPRIFAQDNNNIYISNSANVLSSTTPYLLSGGTSASVDLIKLDLNTMTYDSIRSHFTGQINSLKVKKDSIIVLGDITYNKYLAGVQLDNGAVYNKITKTWSRLINYPYTTGYNSYFKDIAFYGNGFFIGGKFKINNDENLQNLVYWNGNNFDSLKLMPHANTIINTLEITNDTLWVGGRFKLYNKVENFAAYKISTKQWLSSGSVTDYGSNLIQVKKVAVYKNKVFIAGTNFNRYIPYGGVTTLLPDTVSSAGYYDRNNLNNFHSLNRFKKYSYYNFNDFKIKNDSIIYLLGNQNYKGSSCNTNIANCDSSGGIVKYNFINNEFLGYFQSGVNTNQGNVGVTMMAEYNNKTYLFGDFLSLANGINSKNIAANDWESDITTSLNENSNIEDKHEIILHPNPTNDIFYIISNKQIKKIEVFNIIGKLLESSDLENINMELYPSGIYTVKITDMSNKNYVKKLILNH